MQDVWAYSREYGEWIDMEPRGRVPTARVYDAVNLIGNVAYLIGGTFGGFKIDVLRYDLLGNRFSLLYAAGAKPSARSHFSTTVFRDSIYLFGMFSLVHGSFSLCFDLLLSLRLLCVSLIHGTSRWFAE